VLLGLFDNLNPRGQQFNRLMQIIGMPQVFRPSEKLTEFERQDAILDWAAGEGQEGLDRLAGAFRERVKAQRPQTAR